VPIPLPGNALNIFNGGPTPTVYWDGLQITPLNYTIDPNTLTHTFWQLINFSNSNFNSGIHNLTICQIRGPQIVFQSYPMKLMNDQNKVVATANLKFRSGRPVRIQNPLPFTQTSFAPGTPVILKTNITSVDNMNWWDNYKLMITIPSALVGPTYMQITITSWYDNSVRNFNVSMANPVVNMTAISQGISLIQGVQIQVSGINNPLTYAAYPWYFQFWSMFGWPFTINSPNSHRVLPI